MKNISVIGLLLAAVVTFGAPYPGAEVTSLTNRFKAHSSGKMTVTDDPANKAVRFDIEFKPGTDFWAYPVMELKPEESLANVSQIRFEFKAEQGSADAAYTCAYVMIGDEKPYFKLPTPKNEYQSVVIDVNKTVKDPAAVKMLKIGMNPQDPKLTFYIRNMQFLSGKKNVQALDTADAIVVAAPAAAFLQGETLKFKLKPNAAASAKWILKNWQDKIIRQGEWPGSGKEELTLDTLPNGYYQLELLGEDTQEFTGSRSFTVLPDPSRRPANPDMFFALDSAQSWLARPDAKNSRQPDNAYQVVSEVARRAGLGMVRERMSWAEVEPVAGKYDWKQYKTNADLLSQRGVKISGMYHDAPKWAKTNTSQLPGDLLAAYRFAQKAAETFQGQMTDWEFWNEQDIGFAPESAWDYAAALKAAYLGFKAGDPKLPVALGGYARTTVPVYTDVVMQNDAGQYFDIFNIHTYAPVKDFPLLLRGIRDHMERHKISDRPVWFTENGCHMEGSGRLESYMPNLKMHSPDQELLIAEYVPKTMITMQSLGVTRDFFFVLPPYNENGGNKDWGLMRRDFTVKPGLTAFATLTDQLGSAALLGETDLGKGLKGYLYRQKDGSVTLVYWSLSPLDTDGLRPDLSTENRLEQTFSLPKQDQMRNGVDLFGTPFQTSGEKMTASRFPAYLNGVTGLTVSIPFAAPKTAGITENPAIDKTIVFRTELSNDFSLSEGKNCVDVKKDDAKLKLQIWNLSAEPKNGVVTVSGGTVSSAPSSVFVPAFGKTEMTIGFTPKLDDKFKGELRVGGVFHDRRTTSLVIPVQSLKTMVDTGNKVEMPQMLDPANWHKNSSGQTEITYDPAESALAFKTHFPPGVDRWVYPEYILQLPQESLAKALSIGFEVKVSKASAVKQMLVMAIYDNKNEGNKGVNLSMNEEGKAVYLTVSKPKEEWQAQLVQFPVNPEPGGIYKLRLGLNADTDDITYWIRNIRIYYAK